MVINIVGATYAKVVVNGSGSMDETVVLYNYQGWDAVCKLSSLDTPSLAECRAWMAAHPSLVIDQTYHTDPDPYVPPPPPPADPNIPQNIITIDPPSGGDFAATRAYLHQFQDWQPARVRESSFIVYIYGGGLCDSNGRFYTGMGGDRAPPGPRPGGPVAGDSGGPVTDPFHNRPPQNLMSRLLSWGLRLLARILSRR